MLKKRIIPLLLALVLAVSLSIPALAADADASVQTAVTAALQYGGADSLQYAVWSDGSLILTGHTENTSRPESQTVTDDTLYGIGSISKIYTTAAIMQLVESGKVRLDAPVTAYLPNFTMADSRYRQITVRMLLNHSSGLMGANGSNSFLFDDPDRSAAEDLLDILSTQRLKAAPGTYSTYCNDGFTLAELIVEAVSVQSFPAYLQSHIFAPLGLSDTCTPEDSFDSSRLAATYANAQDSRPLPQDTIGIIGAGGLYATASDLAAFGGAFTGNSLLGERSRNAMAAPEYLNGLWPEDDLNSFSFGLGWDSVKTYPFSQNGIQALVKGGDTYLYHSGLVVLPQYHLAAAVVSSGGASTYNKLAAQKLLISALAQRGVSVDESVPSLPAAEKAAMPAALMPAVGYYGSTSQQLRVDLTADGTLSLTCLNYVGSVMTFSYYSDGTFRDAGQTMLIQPVTGKNGQTYLWQKAITPLPGLGVFPTSNYLAMKLPENAVSPELQASWDTAMNKSYLPMNEKATSQLYWMLSKISDMGLESQSFSIPGYVGSCKIVDASHAQYAPQLPELAGRDGCDLTLFQKNGVDWVQEGRGLYMAADGVPALFTGSGWSYSTIQSDGLARWYQVGAAGGKTMTVSVPEHGGFYVYTSTGHLMASSILWGDRQVTLPEGGLLVFAGDAGARFHLRFS